MTTTKARLASLIEAVGEITVGPTVVQKTVEVSFSIPANVPVAPPPPKKPSSVIPGRKKKKPAPTGSLQQQLEKMRRRDAKRKEGRR